MKKRVSAILFVILSLASSVQAKNYEGWYLGAKMGWSHFNLLEHKKTLSLKSKNNETKDSKSADAPVLGLFLGYDFNSYFGLEIENDTTGFYPHLMFQKLNENTQANNIQISTKLSYPITDDFRIYTRLGGMMFWENLTSKDDLKNVFTKNSLIFPSISLGAEYILNNQFITRFDYTLKSTVEEIMNLSKPNLGDAVLSFGWKFGNFDNDVFSSYSPETSNKQYVALNENINFPFNSTELRPIFYDKLKKIDTEINNIKSKNIYITLSGHTDRIGNKEYNQKLSEDRAYSIKNYFTSHGISEDKITIQGMGNQYPLTDQICKGIESRSLLISCLAPDRRVEIEVTADQ
ncbi:Outer membrane protein A [Buchnera aphidicola (Protaphis terricola)]|uniref:OmpA family protein n=1 Tax=Buchnera aphidicola TaxID=9 RepID=UPI003464D4D4